jgi:Fe-S-cluster-containing hydrogenase component 2
MKIVRDPKLCHGCRTCELMCSFHHRRAIYPEFSSIRILRDNATGNISWTLGRTCDECKGEVQRFCERYCLYKAIKGVVL